MKRSKIVDKGICPLCGARGLEYETPAEIYDNSVAYNCSCPCGFRGVEVHLMQFLCFEIIGDYGDIREARKGEPINPATKRKG